MNFSAWNWATHFRLHEAACLIAGVMPVAKKYPTSEELPPQAKPILVNLILAYYEWVMQMHDPDRPKVFCLDGILNPDGTPPLPSLKELTGELVSREAMHRFLSKMEGTGHKSVYDFGAPTPAVLNQDQLKDEATQRAGLIAQAALDRLKKAKTALARREALLISADRPGGLAELEALESAVSAAEKEVEAAQHALCVMRGDYLHEPAPASKPGDARTQTHAGAADKEPSEVPAPEDHKAAAGAQPYPSDRQDDCRKTPTDAQTPRHLGDTPPGGAKSWNVRRPERYRGYSSALHRTLVSIKREGCSKPSAREILERWRTDKPPEIAIVLSDSMDYYLASGDTETANLEAIRKAIDRMVEAC